MASFCAGPSVFWNFMTEMLSVGILPRLPTTPLDLGRTTLFKYSTYFSDGLNLYTEPYDPLAMNLRIGPPNRDGIWSSVMNIFSVEISVGVLIVFTRNSWDFFRGNMPNIFLHTASRQYS